jgi:hypothetical protein
MMVLAAMLLVRASVVEAAPPAAPEGTAESRVNLAFDTTILGPDVAARLEPELMKQLGPVLEQADMQVVPRPDVADQTLSVRVTAFDEEQRNYEVDLQLGSEGGVATLVTVTCDACNERRLVGKLVEETSGLVARHQENLEKDEEQLPLPPVEPPPEPPKRPIGSLGRTGAVMVGFGVMAVATGSFLYGSGVGMGVGAPKHEREPHTLRFAGVGTFAAGLLVAGLGTTLLAVDLNRANKGRARRFGVQVTPTYVGVQIQQRF